MAKPDIDDIRWAQDPAAISAPTTSAQWDLGWVAPGGVEETPILNHQNYWQNAVQKWIEWGDGVFPDVSNIDQQVIDLYEWDTGNQDWSTFLPGIVPLLTNIENIGTSLHLIFFPPEFPVTNNWDTQKSDTWVGARYYELLDIFRSGLGLQIIDAQHRTWLIYANSPTTPITITPGVSSMAPNPGGLAVQIYGGNNDLTVLRNGVEQTLPNKFATFQRIFDPSDTGIFSTLNPGGWRVMLIGTNAISTKFPSPNRGVVRGLQTRRRWIRPLDVARSDAVTQLTNSCSFRVNNAPLYKGSALRVTYNINFNGAAVSAVTLWATSDLTQKMVRIETSTKTDPTMRGTVFPVLENLTGLVVEFNPGKGFKRDVIGIQLPCAVLYGSSGPHNWVVIEELY